MLGVETLIHATEEWLSGFQNDDIINIAPWNFDNVAKTDMVGNLL